MFIIIRTDIEYEFVQSQKGKQLLLIGGYTFRKAVQRCCSFSWVCSTKNSKCKAKLKMDLELNIVSIDNEHRHSPRYCKIGGINVRI